MSRNQIKWFNMKPLAFMGVAFVFLTLMVTACLDEIDLNPEEEEYKRIVVLGKLVNSAPARVLVYVTETFDFETREIPRGIDDATVTVWDDEGHSLTLAPYIETGLYYLEIPKNHPEFKVEAGRSYHLKVVTDRGKQYESAPEPLADVPQTGQLGVNKTTKLIVDNLGEFTPIDILEFSVSTPLTTPGNPEKARLRWEIEEAYKVTDTPQLGGTPKTCYIAVDQNATQVRLFNGAELFSEELAGQVIYDTRPDYRFSEGYYLNVIQESLSEGAFEYWRQTKELLNRTGSMFEAPVGKISTNFRSLDDEREDVFGYFYATTQDTIRQYISPEFAGSPFRLCPPRNPPPGGRPCPVFTCCDCLSEQNSTTEKPDYWVE